MLFPAHERFLIGREPHGITAIYLIIFIYHTFRPLSLRSHRPSAVFAQPSSAAVFAQPSSAVGSLLYVRPLTPNDRIPVGFRHFSCLPSLRHCKDNTFFQGFIYRKSPTFPFGGSGGYTLLFWGKSLGEVSLKFFTAVSLKS